MNARHVPPAVRIIRQHGSIAIHRANYEYMMLPYGHHARARARMGELKPIRREPELPYAPPEDLDARSAAAERHTRTSSGMGDDLTLRLRESIATRNKRGIVMPDVVACVVTLVVTYVVVLGEGWTRAEGEHSYSEDGSFHLLPPR